MVIVNAIESFQMIMIICHTRLVFLGLFPGWLPQVVSDNWILSYIIISNVYSFQLALTHPSYRVNFGTNPDHARNSLSNCGIRQPEYGDGRIHHVNTRKRGSYVIYIYFGQIQPVPVAIFKAIPCCYMPLLAKPCDTISLQTIS